MHVCMYTHMFTDSARKIEEKVRERLKLWSQLSYSFNTVATTTTNLSRPRTLCLECIHRQTYKLCQIASRPVMYTEISNILHYQTQDRTSQQHPCELWCYYSKYYSPLLL